MPAAGYGHEDSKALRGDKFCGCPLDQVNEGDKTEARLSEWLDILAGEGFFGGDATAAPAPAPAAAAPAVEAVPSGLAVELADLAPRFGLTPITDAEMAAVESGGGSEVDGW